MIVSNRDSVDKMRKVNLTLCDEDLVLFERVKKQIGIKTNAEAMRYLINYYARSEGLISHV